MGLIGVQTAISARVQRVSLVGPGGAPVPDGDGGYTVPPAALDPPIVSAEIRPATTADLERLAAGTVLAQASQLVFMPFHPGVDTTTVLSWTDPAGRAHTASVVGAVNVDGRCRELVVGIVEIVP
jgi:hypothetical protein